MAENHAVLTIPVRLNAKFHNVTLLKGVNGNGKIVIREIKHRERQDMAERFSHSIDARATTMQANYLVIIHGMLEPPFHVQTIQARLDMAFKVVCGVALDNCHVMEESMFGRSTMTSGSTRYSYRDNGIRRKDLSLIKTLFGLDRTQNIENVHSILNVAMTELNKNVRLAFWVILLEMIVLSKDERQELGYRLAVRMTKKRKKKMEYFKRIKEFYNKRSEILHNGALGKGDVTKDDLLFIEEEATWFLKEYLLNSGAFRSYELDRNLLE